MYSGLFTQAELEHEENLGYVRIVEHPDFSEMWIANYTQNAAFEGRWNNVTLNCRGLIFDAFGTIIARPFPKFFNYGQVGCPEIDLDTAAIVSDKMDGSLGILYPGQDGKYYIATRGSFTSDQAIKGTEILHTKYANFKPRPGWTYLFEIVYPENRIVCDYGDTEDLVFLGAVHDNGHTYDAEIADVLGWFGPAAEVFEYQTMREALQAEPRAGKEGLVVHLLNSDVRVKIKQEDYVRLHRIVTNLNARSVWQAMVNSKVQELIEQTPDEFHDFVRGVESNISDQATRIFTETYRNYLNIYVDPDMSRKDFAAAAVKTPYRAELFLMFDGKDVYKYILEKLKPAHNYSPIKISNDAD